MSVELVTGYYGVGEDGEPKRHVSSAEDGARQAGTVGLGCYALSTGSKLSATMEDANTLVVADGDVVMNGRHVSLPDPTSFTIPTGVQGQKVSNLAVLRYQKAADSVESVTPIVLTGEPSAGTPTDPAYNEGSILDGDSPVDMPLYRVSTDGINAEDPEPLFDVLVPMADLWDSVSQAPRVYTGTEIVSFPADSETVQVWSSADVQRLFPGVGDFPYVGFSIGDNNFDSWAILGALQVRSGGGQQGISSGDAIFCQSSRATTGLVRLNYVVAGRQ